MPKSPIKVTEEQWREAETQYIAGKISYADVAKMCGCSQPRAAKYGKDHGWGEKRKAYNERVKGKALAKVENKDADRLAKVIEATNKAVDIAVQALSQDYQFHIQLVEKTEEFAFPANPDGTIFDADNNPENIAPLAMRKTTEEREFRKIDTRQLKDLVGVVKECTRLLRDFYGAPTPAEREAQRVAAERLELEKQKAANNIGDDEDETGVVIMPEVMEPDSDG